MSDILKFPPKYLVNMNGAPITKPERARVSGELGPSPADNVQPLPGEQVNMTLLIEYDGMPASQRGVKVHFLPEQLHDLQALWNETLHQAMLVMLMHKDWNEFYPRSSVVTGDHHRSAGGSIGGSDD